VEGLSADFEGASRPGHFRGVSTIVTILLNTIRPDFAFFGQKDAQQLAIIKRLTLDLGFETEIVTVPTLREDSGLAMSSRNQLLSEGDRPKAAIIIQALREAKTAFKKGERNASDLAQIVSKRVEDEPSARLDYVAIVDRESFRPIEKVGENEALIVTAVFIGNIRLIDNVILNRKQ